MRIESSSSLATALPTNRFGSASGSDRLSVLRERFARRQLLSGTLDQTVRLRRSLGQLGSLLRKERGSLRGSSAGAIDSSTELGLSSGRAPLSLSSGQEINSSTSSFTPQAPEFGGTSTAAITVDGVYRGSEDETFTFVATNGGRVGNRRVELSVRDSEGTEIETIRILGRNRPAETQSGITVSLFAGRVNEGDSFQVQAFANVGTSANPDNPFNGTGEDDPNLDPGVQIRAGSFEINDTRIRVFRRDSIQSVLDKINASDAGVTAEFDQAGDRVVLTSDDGSEDADIQLGRDNSGFLAAVKLDAPIRGGGTQNDLTQTISEVGALSGIRQGTFTINDTRVRVDPTRDTLADVLGRIRDEVPGVRAHYSRAEDKVVLQTGGRNGRVRLDDGDSGFFSAIGITPGTFELDQGSDKRLSRPGAVTGSLAEVGKSLNKLFLDQSFAGVQLGGGPSIKQGLENALRSAVEDFVAGDADKARTLRTEFGIDFALDGSGGDVVSVDAKEIARAVRSDPEAFFDFFLQDKAGEADDGLLARLDRELAGIEAGIQNEFGSKGLFLDARA